MKNTINTLTFASVESITGGAFSARIVRKKGASKFWRGALVAYSNEVKKLLGVNIKHGAIDPKVAKEMALKGKMFFGVDYCFAFTGNAGPVPQEGKSVGLVYIAINNTVFKKEFNGNRHEIIQQSVEFALEKLQQLLSMHQ